MGYMKPTEFSLKEIGYNYSPNQTPYENEHSPYDERNKEPIDNISKLEVNSKFKFKYGFANFNLFNIAKASILYSIFEVENHDNSELNDQRINMIKKQERLLRVVLKRLSFEEDLAYMKEKFGKIEREFIDFEDIDDPKEVKEKRLKEYKQQIFDYMEQMGISDDVEKEEHFLHKESALEYSEAREERLSNILRIRYLLSNMNLAMNFSTRSYSIIKEAIVVLKKYSDDQRRAETAEEPGFPQEDLRLDEL